MFLLLYPTHPLREAYTWWSAKFFDLKQYYQKCFFFQIARKVDVLFDYLPTKKRPLNVLVALSIALTPLSIFRPKFLPCLLILGQSKNNNKAEIGLTP